MGKKKHNYRTTAMIAGLATFTALVWMGAVARVLWNRHIQKTPVARAPQGADSKPASRRTAVQANMLELQTVPHQGPGGMFPGDLPTRNR
jgi:hypothetical protein